MAALLKMTQTVSSDADASVRPRLSLVGAERRMFVRKELEVQAHGKRLDHTISARREPTLSLSIRDLSLGGLSAITPTPLGRGERVSVFFPPQGLQRGWDACGRVIRCEPSSSGYRLAVEFEALPLAA